MPKNTLIQKGLMTEAKKVFFDTTPFIYIIENHPEYYKGVASFISEQLIPSEFNFFTSVISIAEFEIRPIKQGQLDVIDKFRAKLIQFNFTILDISLDMATKSSQLRSKYVFLKLIDALQLAAAIQSDCDCFYTNDFRLKQISEIEVILVSK